MRTIASRANLRLAVCVCLAGAVLVGCSSGSSQGALDGGPSQAVDSGPSQAVVPKSQPGFVSCGADACDLGQSNACCTSSGVSDALSCRANYPGPDNRVPCYVAVNLCDEAADCPDPRRAICCVTGAGGPGLYTDCEHDCSTQGYHGIQSCRTDAECGGKPCVAFNCRGATMATCGGLGSDDPACAP